jgi:hypothetical protein
MGGTADVNNFYGLKDIRLQETGSSFYMGFRYRTTEETAVKLNLIYGNAHGTDVGTRNAGRGFSYKTSFFEPSVQYEYYFIRSTKRTTSGLFNRRGLLMEYVKFELYGFIGVGGVYAMPVFNDAGAPPNPATHFINTSSSFSPLIPFGAGIKLGLTKYYAVGFELGRRYLFTDYFDGLSTSYSNHNDIYYFGSFHIIYKLETDRRGVPLIFSKRASISGL